MYAAIPGTKSGGDATYTLLIVLLVLLLIGALPTWPYSAHWGYGPSGLFAILLIVLIVLLGTGRIS
jgi:Protein of unknown function (DUF3309)